MGSSGTQISPTTEEALSMAMCWASWAIPSMVFKTVLELNIIDTFNSAGPEAQLTPTEIAAQLPTNNPDASVVLDRLLRLLPSFTILTYSHCVGPNGQPERIYGLGPVFQFLAKSDCGGSSCVAFVNLMQDKILMDYWGSEKAKGKRRQTPRKHLKDAVLEGGVPFKMAHGMGIFEYLGTDSRFFNVFFSGMEQHSVIVSK